MKSLIDFIKESQQTINEGLVLFKFKKDLIKTQIKAEDGLKNFLKHSKKRYSFNNKTDVKNFFTDYCSYTKLTRSDLKELGITDGKDLINLIASKKDELEKEGFNLKTIKSFDETELQKEYKAWKKSDDYIEGKKFNRKEAEEESEDELKRTLVIYYSEHPGNEDTTLEYEFTGKIGKTTQHQINMFKMDWHYETGLKYYDARPILLSNYLKKSDEELAKREYWTDDDLTEL